MSNSTGSAAELGVLATINCSHSNDTLRASLSDFSYLHPGVAVALARHGDQRVGPDVTVVADQFDGIERRRHHALEVAPTGELIVLPGVVDDRLAGPDSRRNHCPRPERSDVIERLDNVVVRNLPRRGI